MKKLDLSLYLVAGKGEFSEAEFLKRIELALRGGVSVVQLREKSLNSKEFYELGLSVKKLCEAFKVPLIINDRLDIALALDAEGVHLGQDDLNAKIARKILGENKIIGLSAKTKKQVLSSEGADYFGCGAIFQSQTKESSIIGVEGLNALCEVANLPVVAIGGINEKNIQNLSQSKINGIALSSAILKADDVLQSTKRLKMALSNFKL